MPNTREKLIEIAGNVLNYLPWGQITQHTAEDIADKIIESELLENIEQFKWISVKDRLPETNYRVWVIACVDGNKSCVRLFEKVTVRGKLVERFKYPWDTITCENITHWMPLPQPPKGE